MSECISNIVPTTGFQQLQSLFLSFQPPYGAGEIVRFNLAYHRVYPRLNPDERRRSEEWADALVADMAKIDVVRRQDDN